MDNSLGLVIVTKPIGYSV